ncbi:nucleotidyltransferase family protein [Leptodesmis sp.]|uniref:nucleotidyltransferase family protein n=1 Tax=Leptodesmis sp. TaxID=3100501 RepID=UPI0040535A61
MIYRGFRSFLNHQAAQQCINILKQDFGASKVVLFGSPRGDSPWHWESDLDLAVQGLSEEAFWNAYAALGQIIPNWLKIDLVPLERVPAQVAARILETQSMSTKTGSDPRSQQVVK